MTDKPTLFIDMKRIILMVPAELLERIDADAKKCVCGNRSVHLRHVLSTILKK